MQCLPCSVRKLFSLLSGKYQNQLFNCESDGYTDYLTLTDSFKILTLSSKEVNQSSLRLRTGQSRYWTPGDTTRAPSPRRASLSSSLKRLENIQQGFFHPPFFRNQKLKIGDPGVVTLTSSGTR